MRLCILSLLLMCSFAAIASDPHLPGEQCVQDLVLAQSRVAKADLNKDGYTQISIPNELTGEDAKKMFGFIMSIATPQELKDGHFNYGSESDLFVTRVRQQFNAQRPELKLKVNSYLQSLADEINLRKLDREPRLKIYQVEFRIAQNGGASRWDKGTYRIHDDGGYISVDVPLIGIATAIFLYPQDPFPIVSGKAFVYTAQDRAKSLGISATAIGEPVNFAGSRLSIVMRLRPDNTDRIKPATNI